jgi:hypothetical protein
MKLWLLRPRKECIKKDNPWEPWYDKAFGFVIRAKTEKKARCLADQDAGDENDNFSAWTDKKYSTCIELTPSGKEQIILRDFYSA